MYFTGQIITLDSAVVETKCFSLHEDFPSGTIYPHRETIQSNLHTVMKQRKGLLTYRQSELKKTPS